MSLRFHGVKKAFGSCIANRNVTFTAKAGEIHALVGENGAGKSTAMNLLFGLYPHDAGEIEVFGNPCNFRSAADAMKLGIGMVHQHFLLAEPFLVWENLLLFAPPDLGKNDFFNKVKSQSEKYGLKVNLNVAVASLSVGERQKVEILKMLVQEPRILIFDEPTAVLSPEEVISFYKILADLKKAGKVVLVITHRLPEVFRYCDEVTVLRAGETVFSSAVSKTTIPEISDQMVGQVLRATGYDREPLKLEVLLNWKDVTTRGKIQKMNLQLRPGEIFGIAGVEGNGQSELIQAMIFPEEVIVSGNYFFKNTECRAMSSKQLREIGVAALPEDRHRDGMMPEWSLKENLLLGRHERKEFLSRSGFLHRYNWPGIMAKFSSELADYDVRPQDLSATMGLLSGGNQQKVVFARELGSEPDFLICPHPTRGVDIGAIQFLHQMLLRKRTQGVCILLISSDLDELMNLSDRIQVIRQGKLSRVFDRSEFDEKTLGAEMVGGGV